VNGKRRTITTEQVFLSLVRSYYGAMTFSFIHAADLHLGSPLVGIAARDPELAARLATASREAFTALVNQAIAHRVSFLIVAGDIYDGEWKDTSIGLFFNRQVSRLVRAGILVYTLRGNHDAVSVVTQSVRLPDGVFEFPSKSADTVLLDDLKVAIHGRSFSNRAVPENFATSYPAARVGWFNIGVLHTSCNGRPGHDPYAPCSLEDLVSKGYQYWALGHIHEYEQLHADPHVLYPGNLQGRGIHECGAKGALLVHVKDDEVTVERLILDRVRWFDVTVDVEGLTDPNEVHDLLSSLIRPIVAEAEADSQPRLLLVRIHLRGCTALHSAHRSERDQLRDDIQATLQHCGQDIWLEQLKLETTEPVQVDAGANSSLDAFDLSSTLETIALSEALQKEVKELIAELVRKLPAGSSEETAFGNLDIQNLISEARELLLSRSGAAQGGRP
jgi:DNA repair exonuclease SbcCD nuclease subunit